MFHAIAMLGLGWMIYDFFSWMGRGFKPKIDKSSVYTDFGLNITINGVVFTNNGGNGYIDSTGTYLYAKNLNNVDCYWLMPGIAISQHHFLQSIKPTQVIATTKTRQSNKSLTRTTITTK